jgi:hypothetical protein
MAQMLINRLMMLRGHRHLFAAINSLLVSRKILNYSQRRSHINCIALTVVVPMKTRKILVTCEK